MKYIMFVGENTGQYQQNLKCDKQLKRKTPEKPYRQKPVLSHKAQQKGAPVTCRTKIDQRENIFAQPASWVGQKMLSSAF